MSCWTTSALSKSRKLWKPLNELPSSSPGRLLSWGHILLFLLIMIGIILVIIIILTIIRMNNNSIMRGGESFLWGLGFRD